MTPRLARPLLVAATALAAAGLLHARTPDDDTKPADTAPADAAAAAVVVVPFQMLPSNHMVVEAKLNGKGPYRFIFDLGAPVTLLNNKTAEETGAIDKKAPRSFMMGARGEGKIESVQFGDLQADDVPVIVMDHPALRALGGLFNRPLVGIVGYTFWARYKLTIDYQKKQMTFLPVDFEVRDLMKDLPQRMTERKKAKTIVLAPRGLWGLSVGEPTDGLASLGVPITAIVPGSPADKAGLLVGDTLTAIDGRWTTTPADAHHAAETIPPGTSTYVSLLRDGSELTLPITPAEGL